MPQKCTGEHFDLASSSDQVRQIVLPAAFSTCRLPVVDWLSYKMECCTIKKAYNVTVPTTHLQGGTSLGAVGSTIGFSNKTANGTHGSQVHFSTRGK
jgi:hypothetical protein